MPPTPRGRTASPTDTAGARGGTRDTGANKCGGGSSCVMFGYGAMLLAEADVVLSIVAALPVVLLLPPLQSAKLAVADVLTAAPTPVVRLPSVVATPAAGADTAAVAC